MNSRYSTKKQTVMNYIHEDKLQLIPPVAYAEKLSDSISTNSTILSQSLQQFLFFSTSLQAPSEPSRLFLLGFGRARSPYFLFVVGLIVSVPPGDSKDLS